jgi:NADPH:quinone reductase-like Zn-dependent oxidoreductase
MLRWRGSGSDAQDQLAAGAVGLAVGVRGGDPLVDVVLDLVGDLHDSTSTRSLDVLRPGGLVVAIPAGVSPELAAATEAKGMRVTPFLVEPDGPALTTIGTLIDSGEVVVEVEEVFPLARARTSQREVSR